MKTINTIFLIALLFASFNLFAQKILLPTAKFTTQNKDSFLSKNYNDNSWATIATNTNYELLGYENYNGYSWYRFHFNIPTTLKSNAVWKDSLVFDFSKIDDCAAFYFNGNLIEKSGSFPYDENGYISTWSKRQVIKMNTNNPLILWDSENIMAIKVYDGGGGGGIFGEVPFVNMLDIIDGIKLKTEKYFEKDLWRNYIVVANSFNTKINGTLNSYAIKEDGTEKLLDTEALSLNGIAAFNKQFFVRETQKPNAIRFVFTDSATKKIIEYIYNVPYILTPKEKATPKINSATHYGVSPNHPFLFKVPATGKMPLIYSASNLPKGLVINSNTGIITGQIPKAGNYNVTLKVKNTLGSVTKNFIIKCGGQIVLTPPMGWNSWNCWGLEINQEKVQQSADVLLKSGLANHGYNFINIDDGWEAEKRTSTGLLLSNNKFPSIKKLSNFLHKNGLKFGIYSSPGKLTCGGFLGSLNFENKDAALWNSWGVDYLKYDWCSYNDQFAKEKDTSLNAYKKPYFKMKTALAAQPRDIVYSLCQYGMKNVGSWGSEVGGQLWRTTGDIEDSWESLSGIGFSQTNTFVNAKPGAFNDPDMLVVGHLGWGANTHPTRLTPSEQYTHISLWAMLSAPLILGCDLSKIDDFTYNLLANDEVIAIDQDELVQQAQQKIKTADYQIWVKQLANNKKAIAIFNTSTKNENITINFETLGLKNNNKLRDVWQQKDLGNFNNFFTANVYTHGVVLLVVD